MSEQKEREGGMSQQVRRREEKSVCDEDLSRNIRCTRAPKFVGRLDARVDQYANKNKSKWWGREEENSITRRARQVV